MGLYSYWIYVIRFNGQGSIRNNNINYYQLINTAKPQFKGARGFFEKVPYIEDLPQLNQI